jgi:nitrite reductase/ring-hydroxylating ferredoxin subunit
MTLSSPDGGCVKQIVARVGELTHGRSKKFILRCGENAIEAMVINYNGTLYAYVNRCRHVALSLDWVDNRFFTDDRRYLICANHGALYEPKSGECIWGPCVGASLQRVPLEEEGENVYAWYPQTGESCGLGANEAGVPSHSESGDR